MKNSKFQFTKPVVENIVFNVSNEQVKDKKIEIKNEIGIVIENINVSNNEYKVILTVKVGVHLEDSEEFDLNGVPFYTEVTMSANFRYSDIGDQETIDGLLRRNASILLLSYIRPIVHYLTGLSKFPPYDIPFLDLSEENN